MFHTCMQHSKQIVVLTFFRKELTKSASHHFLQEKMCLCLPGLLHLLQVFFVWILSFIYSLSCRVPCCYKTNQNRSKSLRLIFHCREPGSPWNAVSWNGGLFTWGGSCQQTVLSGWATESNMLEGMWQIL